MMAEGHKDTIHFILDQKSTRNIIIGFDVEIW